MTRIEESLWLEKRQLTIIAECQETQKGIRIAHYANAKHSYQKRLMSEEFLDLPAFSMERAYSGWVNLFPSETAEGTAEKMVASFIAGHCLGAILTQEVVTALPAEALDKETVSLTQVPEGNKWVVAQKGTLEDYLPLAQMDEFFQQVAIHYPRAEVLTHWRLNRPELEVKWSTLKVTDWLVLELETVEGDLDYPFLLFLSQLIQGIPFGLYLLGGAEMLL